MSTNSNDRNIRSIVSRTSLIFVVCISLFVQTTMAASSDFTPAGYNTPIPLEIMTADNVETRVGTLQFVDGFPTSNTVETLYENLDFMRGVELFLKLIPAASMEAIRRGGLSQGQDDYNKVMVFDELLDSNPLFLTGNTDTVYAFVLFDLSKTGPLVFEMPQGMGPSTINDAFFRFVVDMGTPGPDRGMGGKYLILPPDYDGDIDLPEIPKDGAIEVEIDGENYYVSKSRSYFNMMLARGFLVDGKTDVAVEIFREGLQVYPYSSLKDPQVQKKEDGVHQRIWETYEYHSCQ